MWTGIPLPWTEIQFSQNSVFPFTGIFLIFGIFRNCSLFPEFPIPRNFPVSAISRYFRYFFCIPVYSGFRDQHFGFQNIEIDIPNRYTYMMTMMMYLYIISMQIILRETILNTKTSLHSRSLSIPIFYRFSLSWTM